MSKQIKFESNYGFFAYRLTAEIGDEVNEATTALAVEGLANFAYRIAGSAVDKALGVKTKKGKKFDKRVEVSYDEETAQTINRTVSDKIVELIKEKPVFGALNLSFAVTGQHEYGSTDTASKEATELWTKVQSLAPEHFEKACKTLGIDPEDYDDEKGVAACMAHIRKEKEAAKLRAKSSLGL